MKYRHIRGELVKAHTTCSDPDWRQVCHSEHAEPWSTHYTGCKLSKLDECWQFSSLLYLNLSPLLSIVLFTTNCCIRYRADAGSITSITQHSTARNVWRSRRTRCHGGLLTSRTLWRFVVCFTPVLIPKFFSCIKWVLIKWRCGDDIWFVCVCVCRRLLRRSWTASASLSCWEGHEAVAMWLPSGKTSSILSACCR